MSANWHHAHFGIVDTWGGPDWYNEPGFTFFYEINDGTTTLKNDDAWMKKDCKWDDCRKYFRPDNDDCGFVIGGQLWRDYWKNKNHESPSFEGFISDVYILADGNPGDTYTDTYNQNGECSGCVSDICKDDGTCLGCQWDEKLLGHWYFGDEPNPIVTAQLTNLSIDDTKIGTIQSLSDIIYDP